MAERKAVKTVSKGASEPVQQQNKKARVKLRPTKEYSCLLYTSPSPRD